MPITWSDDIAALDWDELAALYQAAPLGSKSAQELKTAFTRSGIACLAYDDGHLVAAGRALADGVDFAYLCDVAVMPSHQGTGLGQQVVTRLLERVAGHKKILLYSVPGKEGFYKRFGFKRMRTAMAIFRDPAAALARGHIDDT